jgi:DNA-binding NtrC family response regulator
VKQHGGNIKVASKVGCGTTFTIALPALTAGEPGTRRTILVVQDGEVSREFSLDDVVDDGQYEILKASDFREAVDMAACHSGPIDLSIVDGLTPGFLRPHLLKLLAREHPGMKIICVDDAAIGRQSLRERIREALTEPAPPRREGLSAVARP